jgi:hypothetical protein
VGQWRHGQRCSAGSVTVRTVVDAYQPSKCSVGQLLLVLSHQWGHRWDSGGTDSGAQLDQWRCGQWWMRTNQANAVWDNCSLHSSTSGDTDGIVAVRTAMGQWRYGQGCSAGSVAVRTVGDAYQPPKCSVGQLLLALFHQWGHRWDSGGADSDGTVAARTELLSWISGGADSGRYIPTTQMQCGTIAPCSLPSVGTQMG